MLQPVEPSRITALAREHFPNLDDLQVEAITNRVVTRFNPYTGLNNLQAMQDTAWEALRDIQPPSQQQLQPPSSMLASIPSASPPSLPQQQQFQHLLTPAPMLPSSFSSSSPFLSSSASSSMSIPQSQQPQQPTERPYSFNVLSSSMPLLPMQPPQPYWLSIFSPPPSSQPPQSRTQQLPQPSASDSSSSSFSSPMPNALPSISSSSLTTSNPPTTTRINIYAEDNTTDDILSSDNTLSRLRDGLASLPRPPQLPGIYGVLCSVFENNRFIGELSQQILQRYHNTQGWDPDWIIKSVTDEHRDHFRWGV